MPTSKKAKHGSGKQRKPKPLSYHPIYTDKISQNELREALHDKLSLPELVELESQIRRIAEDASKEAAAHATEEAYERQFATMMRVMRDRFGFGKKRLHRLWDACLEYIHEIDEGLLTTEEMLKCLENEDGIKIRWTVQR